MHLTGKDVCELTPEEKEQIKEIFFSSANREFNSKAERFQFYRQWLSPYFEEKPSESFCSLAVCGSNKIAGYAIGTAKSAEFLQAFEDKLKSYQTFQDLFDRFPAHLHINLDSKYRGQGLGSKLLTQFCRQAKEKQATGLHLVTSPEARNVSFYRKNGFDYEMQRPFQGGELLFFGRSFQDQEI